MKSRYTGREQFSYPRSRQAGIKLLEIAEQPTAKKRSHLQRREEIQKNTQSTSNQLEKDPNLTWIVQELDQMIPTTSKAGCSTIETTTQICADQSAINQAGKTITEKFVWNGISMTLITEDPKPKKVDDKNALAATNANLDFQAYLDMILPPPAFPSCLEEKVIQKTEIAIPTSGNILKSPQILEDQEQGSRITKSKRKYQRRKVNSKSAIESSDSAATGGSGLPGFAAGLNLPSATSITYAPPPPTILQVLISITF